MRPSKLLLEVSPALEERRKALRWALRDVFLRWIFDEFFTDFSRSGLETNAEARDRRTLVFATRKLRSKDLLDKPQPEVARG